MEKNVLDAMASQIFIAVAIDVLKNTQSTKLADETVFKEEAARLVYLCWTLAEAYYANPGSPGG